MKSFSTLISTGGTNRSIVPIDEEIERNKRTDEEIVLNLPVPDISLGSAYVSTNHPSVAVMPGGFLGYTHWMAFMRYPDVTRENACVCAGYDGVNWEKPPGLPDIIETRAALAAIFGVAEASVWHGGR